MDKIAHTLRLYRAHLISRDDAYATLSAYGMSAERIEETLDW